MIWYWMSIHGRKEKEKWVEMWKCVLLLLLCLKKGEQRAAREASKVYIMRQQRCGPFYAFFFLQQQHIGSCCMLKTKSTSFILTFLIVLFSALFLLFIFHFLFFVYSIGVWFCVIFIMLPSFHINPYMKPASPSFLFHFSF